MKKIPAAMKSRTPPGFHLRCNPDLPGRYEESRGTPGHCSVTWRRKGLDTVLSALGGPKVLTA